jgi:hypothetical protein
MIIDWPAAVREARTRRLLDNLATLRKRRNAIFAELETIRASYDAPDVAPCNTCGNDFEDRNCECEAPTFEHFDY